MHPIVQEILIAGFLGMILQMLMKARSLQAKAKSNNDTTFKFWKYFTDDWLSHLISTIAVILYVILARKRAVTAPESAHEIILGFSATIGYTGADLVSRFFSFTNKRLNGMIDIKSNISDTLVGNTVTREELIQKGNEATGTDVTTPPLQTKTNNP